MLRELAGCTNSVTRGIRSGHVIVDCAHYTTEGRREEAPLTMPEAADRLGGEGFVWLALRDPSDEELAEVEQRFDLPPLAVEDARESHQRPKIEDYDDDWFVVLKAATYDARARSSTSTRSRCSRDRASPSSSGRRDGLPRRRPQAARRPPAAPRAGPDRRRLGGARHRRRRLRARPRRAGARHRGRREGDLRGGPRPDPAHLLPPARARPLLPRRAPAAQRAAGAGRDTTRPETTDDARVLPRRRRPPAAPAGGAGHAARRARRRAEREPRRDLGTAERHRAQGLRLGGDRDRPDAHREHLRHELPAHARAALGHRLSARDRPHGRSVLHPLALPARWGWL